MLHEPSILHVLLKGLKGNMPSTFYLWLWLRYRYIGKSTLLLFYFPISYNILQFLKRDLKN